MASPCPHCPDDGHGNPLRRSWGVRVAPDRDDNGQPVALHVAPSNGAHVAESDAEWIHALIEGDQTSASQIVDELLGPLNAQIGVAEYEQREATKRAELAEAAVARVRALAERWAAIAPPYGPPPTARHGSWSKAVRALLAALDQPATEETP